MQTVRSELGHRPSRLVKLFLNGELIPDSFAATGGAALQFTAVIVPVNIMSTVRVSVASAITGEELLSERDLDCMGCVQAVRSELGYRPSRLAKLLPRPPSLT